MYKNKTIVGSLIALIITILFLLLYAFIHTKAEEKDYSTFEATTGLVGLIVAIVSAIYVYNAYTTQRELIAIQKKEIEDNRKDTEFNRSLDIIFRQVEKTYKKWNPVNQSLLNLFTNANKNIDNSYSGVSKDSLLLAVMKNEKYIRLSYNFLLSEFKMFEYFIDSKILDDQEVIKLKRIIWWNLHKQLDTLTARNIKIYKKMISDPLWGNSESELNRKKEYENTLLLIQEVQSFIESAQRIEYTKGIHHDD